MYTSGTTGKPNGVEIPHRGITRLVIANDYFPFGPKHTFLQLAPISFDASTFEIWGALLHGSKLVLYPERIPSFLNLKKLIKENNISCLWLTASLFNMVIEEEPDIISDIPFVLTGGEALSVKFITLAQRYAPNTLFINGYGPTESTTFTCCYQIPSIDGQQLKSIPIGKPISNTDVYILNSELKPVERGETGELYIGGMGLAKGYHKKPELTSQKFITNPFDITGESRLYKTGDLCRVNKEENIEFLGRIDNQVKLRGFRIELDEIENCLQQHECINDCIVSVKKADGYDQLVAYYTTDSSKSKDNAGQTEPNQVKNHLKDYLSKKLPDYMVPNYFIEMEKFPLNANGKIDRLGLPDPVMYVESENNELSEILSETENKIVHIWEDVLNLKNIKTTDNFFAIGGHSLLATKIVYKVNKIFGGNLLVSSLFQAPTLREFAQHVQQTEKHEITGEIIQLKPGFGKPVFLFSGVDGNPFTFTKLASYYQTEQPLYFIQYPAGSSKEIKFESLEDYVKDLVIKIRIIQPAGPYYIVGYSLGGRFAFETALQLQKAGEIIKLLAILSALPPLFTNNTNPFINFLLIESDVFFKVSFSLKMKYLRHRVRHIFERFFRKLSDTTGEGKFENVHLFVDIDEEVKNYLGMYNLWRTYAIKTKFNGNVLMIRETGLEKDLKYTSYYFDQAYPDYHWSKYIEGNVIIEPIPFDHNSMLEEPHVKEIAFILNNFCRQSEDNRNE
jgi:thioesterase domain-containing protein